MAEWIVLCILLCYFSFLAHMNIWSIHFPQVLSHVSLSVQFGQPVFQLVWIGKCYNRRFTAYFLWIRYTIASYINVSHPIANFLS